MHDRTIRRLSALEHSASTARVLNLMATHRRFPEDPQLGANPMFHNRLLNRGIILKHRLRPNEYDLFGGRQTTATKVLLPIDGADLRAGAQSFFVRQDGYESVLETTFGADLKMGTRDRLVLELIDDLPSLDPFLLRENLRHHDLAPASAFFAISEADTRRMSEFVRNEILALVLLSTGQKRGAVASAARMVDQLLSTSPEQVFEPLRDALGFSDQKYADGIFSWRGFLYYKWMLSTLKGSIRGVMEDIAAIQGRGAKTAESFAYLGEAKRRILNKLTQAYSNARVLLDVYDDAYKALTVDRNPIGFRNFLVSAPDMFVQLGEQLGAIEHVVSFWTYAMPRGAPKLITIEELVDLFVDFEAGLAGIPDDHATLWAQSDGEPGGSTVVALPVKQAA